MRFGQSIRRILLTSWVIGFCLNQGELSAVELQDTLRGKHSLWQELFQPATAEKASRIQTRLNWVDQFLTQENFIVVPADDWGVKGVVSPAGLPPYALRCYLGNLVERDPLYGQMPLVWSNFRVDSIRYLNPATIVSRPRFGTGEGVHSRFDYYRGDYGFLDFALYADGQIQPNQRWRFVGENCAYDGYRGLLGADATRLRESISQNFRVDFWADSKKPQAWQVNVGAAYQKYQPGLWQTIPYGTLLQWKHSGKLTEYRAQLYTLACQQRADGSISLSGQFSGWIYGSFPANGYYAFKGIANQGDFIVEREWSGSRWQKSITLEHYYQELQLRRYRPLYDRYIRGHLCFSRQGNYKRALTFGFQNRTLVYDLSWNFLLGKRWELIFQTYRDYLLYPQIYRLKLPRWQPIAVAGSSYGWHQLGASYQRQALSGQVSIMLPTGKIYTPVQQGYADTLVSFVLYSLKKPVLNLKLAYETPWHTALQFKTIGAPQTGPVELLIWGSIQQRLRLFKGNLELCVGGEFIYWGGAERWGWFDELRSFGQLQASYFTNNRLTGNVRVDGYIGDLHLFYLVNNAEGRSFATINGIPYRNMLRIFGVEWSFLN